MFSRLFRSKSFLIGVAGITGYFGWQYTIQKPNYVQQDIEDEDFTQSTTQIQSLNPLVLGNDTECKDN